MGDIIGQAILGHNVGQMPTKMILAGWALLLFIVNKAEEMVKLAALLKI